MNDAPKNLKSLLTSIDIASSWAALLAIATSSDACIRSLQREADILVWTGDDRALDVRWLLSSIVSGQYSNLLWEACEEYLSSFYVNIEALGTRKTIRRWTPGRHAAQVAICVGYLETHEHRERPCDVRLNALGMPLLAPRRDFLATMAFAHYCSARMLMSLQHPDSTNGVPLFDSIACFVSVSHALHEQRGYQLINCDIWRSIQQEVGDHCVRRLANIDAELSASDAVEARSMWGWIVNHTLGFSPEVTSVLAVSNG